MLVNERDKIMKRCLPDLFKAVTEDMTRTTYDLKNLINEATTKCLHRNDDILKKRHEWALKAP